MNKYHLPCDSIEGNKIKGNSRRPLINRGLRTYKGKRVHRFTADTGVKAEITQVLKEDAQKIDINAYCNLGDILTAKKVIIHSIKNKYKQEVKEGETSTHGASLWYFSHQTNVIITTPLEDIQKAIINRMNSSFSQDKISK